MEKGIYKGGGRNFMVIFVGLVLAVICVALSRSMTAAAVAFFSGLGVLITMVSVFHMSLVNREQLEKLELEELQEGAEKESLFEAGDPDALPARRSRENFERYAVSSFTVGLFLLMVAGAWFLYTLSLKRGYAGFQLLAKTNSASEVLFQPPDSVLVIILSFAAAALLFVVGKYSAGVSRLKGMHLLQPGSEMILLLGYLNFALTVVAVAVKAEFLKADLMVAGVMVAFLLVVALEILVMLVLEIYRPRVKGKEARVLYHSRLVGLVSRPESFLATAAHALDYQFGFKVSETQGYKFIQRWIGAIVAGQALLFWLSTSVYVIQPWEQGVVERLGSPKKEGGNIVVEHPGFHLKLPWPMDRLYRYEPGKVQKFYVGSIPKHDPNNPVVAWGEPHSEEPVNMVVQPVRAFGTDGKSAPDGDEQKRRNAPDLLSISIPVQFKIINIAQWAYGVEGSGNAQPRVLLENLAKRKVTAYLLTLRRDELLTTGRQTATREIMRLIQESADDKQLGVEILNVGFQGVHPPMEVVPAFEGVMNAEQESLKKILDARGEAIHVSSAAAIEANRIITEARVAGTKLIQSRQSQTASFTNEYAVFRLAPTIYPRRAKLNAIYRAIKDVRKFVLITTNTTDVINLNLETKVRDDLTDLDIPDSPRGGK